jgi:A/G-specific adenine glycosylase
MGHTKYKGTLMVSVTVQSVTNSLNLGRLPDDPAVLEKEIEGVGRYTAGMFAQVRPQTLLIQVGAICSMAYGVKTPIVSQTFTRWQNLN